MTAKDLKNALLQEAVQGKLVPQIAAEGNARDLLEEIRKEKLSHGFANSYGICGEKGKKSKSSDLRSKSQIRVTKKELPEITEEEIPFDIPENWCWCRLGELVDLRSGNQYNETSSGTLYLKVADLNLQENFYEIKTSTRYTNSNDDSFIPQYSIIFPKRGGAIATNKKKLVLKEKVYVDSNTMGMTPKNKDLLPYLNMWFDSIDLGKLSSGTSVPQINNKDLLPLAFPLPPLAEQKRIVTAIEKFMPLIEEYGKKETQLKAINKKIGKLTKKAILQEAVQGKLVPQIAAEENARDLLEEIRKERLSHGFANSYGICSEKGKKSKSSDLRSKSQIRVTKKELPEITEEEIPFDIPESWCWCRLGEIGDWKAGSTPSRSNPELYNGNIPWLKTGDLTDGDINEIPECISEKALESCSMRLNPIGSVLIAMYGATIGKLGILKIEATTNQACCACVPYNGIYNKYLFYYLMSQKKDFTEKAEGGAQPNISREKLVVHLILCFLSTKLTIFMDPPVL